MGFAWDCQTNHLRLNILFIYQDPDFQEEISDFFGSPNGRCFFARSTEEAIHILNTEMIVRVVLQIRNLRDAAVLKYINEYYQGLDVLVMASREYDDIISVFSKGRYRLMRQPQHLAEIREALTVMEKRSSQI